MNKLIKDIIISDKLITNDEEKMANAKQILEELPFDELLKLINIKSKMIRGIDNEYKRKTKSIQKTNQDADLKKEMLNDIVLDFYIKRKEIEYRFLERVLKNIK